MEVPVRFLRTEGNYDVAGVSVDTGLHCTDPSRTRQDQKEESDINTIVKNFGLSGVMPVTVRPPSYGDFDAVDDYQTALAVVAQAQEAFMQLPADVRKRFDNDPGAFVDFCSDEKNAEEIAKLGLSQGGSAGVAPASSSAS